MRTREPFTLTKRKTGKNRLLLDGYGKVCLKAGITSLPYSGSRSTHIPESFHTRSTGFSHVQFPSPAPEKGKGYLERLLIQKGDQTEHHAEVD